MIPKFSNQSSCDFKDYLNTEEKAVFRKQALFSKIKPMIKCLSNTIKDFSLSSKPDSLVEPNDKSNKLNLKPSSFINLFGDSSFFNELFHRLLLNESSRSIEDLLPENKLQSYLSSNTDPYSDIFKLEFSNEDLVNLSLQYKIFLEIFKQEKIPPFFNQSINSDIQYSLFQSHLLIDILIDMTKRFSSAKTIDSNLSQLSKQNKLDFNYSSSVRIPISKLIPELRRISTKGSYPEIMYSLSKLSDDHLLFINVLKSSFEDSLITGIVFLPYSPKTLPLMSDYLILLLAHYIYIKVDYLPFQKIRELLELNNSQKVSSCITCIDISIKIIRQKLLDIFYFVQDNEDLHGITFCHSCNKQCNEKASLLCTNLLCKVCCQVSIIINI